MEIPKSKFQQKIDEMKANKISGVDNKPKKPTNMKTNLIIIAIAVLSIVGYIKCVVRFVQCDFEPSYKAEVIYGIGSLTGLGAVIGWMDLGK